jgi:ElaB/YqjD/DUF883 family membrane-anchored ribosome-binding protein
MSESLTEDVRHKVEDGLDDVANALKRSATNLTGDAQAAVAKAAADVAKAAESLSNRAAKTGKSIAGKAVHEVQEHPIAALATAITAAAALVGVLVASQHKSS